MLEYRDGGKRGLTLPVPGGRFCPPLLLEIFPPKAEKLFYSPETC